MNALLKRDPDEETAKMTDSGISLELLHSIYDHLDDLVSAAVVPVSLESLYPSRHSSSYTNLKSCTPVLNQS